MSSWRNYLLRIGDNCSEYGTCAASNEHIETCFSVVRRQLEHSDNQDDIQSFLLDCAEELPHKIPLYAVLIGLLNVETEEFVAKVLEKCQTLYQDALEFANCNRIRILMRFFTVLMSCRVIQPLSLVGLFEGLLSTAATIIDDEKGNPYWQPCGDFYVTCVLSCLPWGGLELTEQVPEDLERILVNAQAYLSIRKHDPGTGLSFYDVSRADLEKDFLEDLWDRVQGLSSNDWKLDSVSRPQFTFEAQLVAGKCHQLIPITIPPFPTSQSKPNFGKQKHDAEQMYPQRIHRLGIFLPDKYEDLQPIDCFIVEDCLLDILLFFTGCRKECVSYMAGLPVPFRYEYIMAETIFSQLLLLPHPPCKMIYYTLVVIDLCKALPGAFPSVVAAAVRSLFERIPDLDIECRIRLIMWFSHHLSNFQFIWPWEDWAYVLDFPKWAPQRVFVQEVFEREVRLSYWERVKQSIENAPGFEELLPSKDGAKFVYMSEEGAEITGEHKLSSELGKKVKERQPSQDIMSWIGDSMVPSHGVDITIKIVSQTLLQIGSKSFTHLVTVLERYGQIFSWLCPDHDKQLVLIQEVSFFWKNSNQMTAIVIDRMMGYRLISNLAIVSWVFLPENVEQFHTSDRLWEVLRNAISKTFNRICDLRKEVTSLKKKLVCTEDTVSDAIVELNAAESKLNLVDGQPVLGENSAKMNRLKFRVERAKEKLVSISESVQAKGEHLAKNQLENEEFFLCLYRNFLSALSERLASIPNCNSLQALKSRRGNGMALDLDIPSAMELDVENGREKISSENVNGTYNTGEKEEWCLTTLGYLRSFSRQFASEIWHHMDRLDKEIFSHNLHPLAREVVCSGLRRPFDS